MSSARYVVLFREPGWLAPDFGSTWKILRPTGRWWLVSRDDGGSDLLIEHRRWLAHRWVHESEILILPPPPVTVRRRPRTGQLLTAAMAFCCSGADPYARRLVADLLCLLGTNTPGDPQP